ncbi:restriction endonuclease subunit S [Acinetobacter proteolyticus]|nr:restriction endonuclease subunit S [Acinetobacter proteolyticus]WEI18476.1 restriction endonuclease subunit S [Acinetobacter proteolyticus]
MYKKYDAYKDSGVQWLGNIPNDWGIKRLKFLSSIKTGDKNTEDKNDEGIYPFFVRSQIPEKINTYSFDGEAILTAGDGAGVGKVYHYINGKFDYHQRVYKFSNFKSVIGKFIYYYLLSNFYNVAILGTAKSTVDSLRLPLIQDFNITYPTDVLSQKK